MDPHEEAVPEVNADELVVGLLEYFDSYKLATITPLVIELEKALDQEFKRGAEEARAAISTALRYRPISRDEVE